MKAHEICMDAAALVAGDRHTTYGDKTKNHENIASLWSVYLGYPISSRQAAIMMCLLKIARTKLGDHNIDDYVDLAGYAGVAGEIAEGRVPAPKPDYSGIEYPTDISVTHDLMNS